MQPTEIQSRVIQIVEAILAENGHDNVSLTADDSMDTVSGWDSLMFMAIYERVNESFGIDPSFDEAINYTGIPTLTAFLNEQLVDAA